MVISVICGRNFMKLLCKEKFHYRVHKAPLMVSILIQLNSIYTFISCFRRIHFNIIITFTVRSHKFCMRAAFFHQILYEFVVSPVHVPIYFI